MRVNAGGNQQSIIYDRNPLSRSLFFNFSAPPHASTIRSSYLVPAGRNVLLTQYSCDLKRSTAAVTPRECYGSYRIVRPPFNRLADGRLSQTLINVDDFVNRDYVVNVLAQPGDTILIETRDGSAGGDVIYLLLLSMLEFDA